VNNPLPASPSISRNGNVLSTNATTGIQWFYNGNIIAGSTSSTINANQNGLYYVVVTNAAGCTATSLTLQVTGVGVQENLSGRLSLYPNPASESVTLILPEVMKAEGNVQILDLQGKVMFSTLVLPGTKQISLNLETIKSGIYFVSIQTSEAILQGKFVKH
jgi:hypothetical protein